MLLSKKQVKALLNLCGDSLRPALASPFISSYKGDLYLTVTNSYALAAIRLNDNASFGGAVDFYIPHSSLVRWYKLADSRDQLRDKDLLDMMQSMDYKPPKWQPLFLECKPMTRSSVLFDVKLLTNLINLAGANLNLKFYTHQDAYQFMANNGDDLFCLMPMRGNDE